MRMLFLPPLLLPTVRPLIFPLVSLVPSHSWTLPPLPSSTLPPLLHLFLSSPALFLHRCFLISAVSVSSFTTPRWCDDAVLAASQTPTNFAPPPPHLPPDAINTQHRWVIAQTYQLPLSLLSASPSSPPHHPLSLCSSSLPDLTHFPTSTLAPAPRWPSWAKPRSRCPCPARSSLPSESVKPEVNLTHYQPKKTKTKPAWNRGLTRSTKTLLHHIHRLPN